MLNIGWCPLRNLGCKSIKASTKYFITEEGETLFQTFLFQNFPTSERLIHLDPLLCPWTDGGVGAYMQKRTFVAETAIWAKKI